MRLLVILLAVLCFAPLHGQATFSATPTPHSKAPQGLAEMIRHPQLFELDVPALDAEVQRGLRANSNSEVRLLIGAHDWTLQLYPTDLLAPDYYLSTGTGRTPATGPQKQKAFRGYVNGDPTDEVRLTLDGDFFYGFVEQGNKTYYFEPLRHFAPGSSLSGYALYEVADVINTTGTCGVTEVANHRPDPNLATRSAVGDCYILELAIASDFSMFQKYGSVANVENYTIGVINNVQANYDDEFADEIFILITTQFVAATAAADPFTSSTNVDDLLDDFRIWGQGGGFGGASYDMGEMWSNRDFDGVTVGYAYVGEICSSFRYHILQDFTTNAVEIRVMTSHEMGHNWSMLHDAQFSPFIMAPSVGTSDIWSNASINAFTSHLAQVLNNPGCLTGCGAPTPDFIASATEVCPGTPIQFTNLSAFSPTGFVWSFPGGTPASSTAVNPTVTYANAGTYDVILTATNSFGSNTETKNGYITISPTSNDVLFVSDFENGLADWSVINPDGLTTWDFGTVNLGGNPDNVVAFINNYNYNAVGQPDELVSPAVDLSNRSSATFTLQYAYAAYASPNGSQIDTDSLVVSVSTNNGATYTRLFAGGDDGNGSFGSAPPNTQIFVPQDDTEWCILSSYGPSCLSLDMSAYVGFSQVRVKLTNINNYGNTLLLNETQILASCPGSAPVAPVANFSSNAQQGCTPFQVQFTDQSANSPTTYSWSFPGGNPATSTIADPTVTYNTPGTYNVQLTVGNGAGQDTQVSSDYITVASAPIPNFSFTIAGNTVNFSSTSQFADTYSWTFGNGDTAGTENPSTTYAGPGTYPVTLTVSNACGTTSTTQNVVIAAAPGAAFSATTTTGCAPFETTFTNQSTNADSYAWSFPGGTPASSTAVNPTVTYATPGTYTVELVATNNVGSTTATQTNYVTVLADPTPAFSITDNGNGSYTFTNNSANADTYSWTFGDGNGSTDTNPTHTYAADGTYTVTLTATNTCGSETTTQTITLVTAPTAAFGASTTVGCADLTVQFNSQGSSGAGTYSWAFEGGTPATSTVANPTVTYASAGTFDVSLIITNGAGTDEAVISDFIVVADVPSPSFTAFVDNQTVTFTHTGSGADSYLWNFGDGNTSTQENPTHVYADDADYTVTLTTTNGCGDAEIVQTVVVSTQPFAQFTATNTIGCTPLTVQFTSQSSANTAELLWSFPGGDPATSTVANPTVTYNMAGVYSVTLTVANAAGSDEQTNTDYITVATTPTPAFGSSVSGSTATFTNSSTGADSFSWNFGDGNSSTSANPVHTYANDGTYTVTLSATNGCGTETTTQTVTISNQPTALFTVGQTSGCAPFTVTFTNQSSANSTSFAWSFPGGSPATSTAMNPTVTYATAGSYDVSLTVTNAAGSDEQMQTNLIDVGSAPSPDFTAQVNDQTVQFTYTGTAATSYAWTFGDGNTATGPNPSHTYATDGNYVVTVTATNECGSTDFEQTVVVSTQPFAQFSADAQSGCAPFTVTFNNQSSANSTGFAWSFPGGSPATSTEMNPTVTYNTAGSYDVTLTVTNAAGSDEQTQTNLIEVGSAPSPNFTAQVNDQTVQFTYTGSAATSYAWDFGNGNTATGPNPSHTYAMDGNYVATVTATNACGSTDFEQTVVVSTQPFAQFSADVQSGCLPLTVTFNNQSSTNSTGFAWSFPGGSPATSTAMNPSVTYFSAGSYDVELTATNAAGTNTSSQAAYIVVEDEPAANFGSSVNGLTVTFSNTSTATDSYLWDFGDLGFSFDENPVYTYAADGTYTVSLTVTNNCGMNTETQQVTVVTAPTAAFTADQTSGCAPFTVQFNSAASANTTGWVWTFEGGTPTTSSDPNPTVTYNQAGTYDVLLTVSNAAGTDQVSQTAFITVDEVPVAAFNSSSTGSTYTFTNQSTNADTYLWDFGDGNTSTDESPVHTYAMDGAYTVTLTATNACGSTEETTIATVANGAPLAAFGAAATTGCAPFTVEFENLSSSNAESFMWSFPGGTPANSTAVAPSVIYNEPGSYDVTLTATNANGTNESTQAAFILVRDVPTAGFAAVTDALSVDFTDTSTDADSYSWDFGNGTTSTLPDPSVTYADPGDYLVTLTVTNSCGENTFSQQVSVVSAGQLPIPSFTANERVGCTPFTVTFSDESLNEPTSWNWTFEGGTPATSTEQNPVVVYNEAGEYNVQLQAGNNIGNNILVSNDYITVGEAPEAEFTYAQDAYDYSFESQTPGDSYLWDFGDGTTATGASPAHTYATQGTFVVTLTVTNECGSDTTTEAVVVVVNSLSDALDLQLLRVSPNPNDGRFLLEIIGPPGRLPVELRLVDMLGRTLSRRVSGFETGRLTQAFDESMAAGMYLLQVRIGERSSVRKIIVE